MTTTGKIVREVEIQSDVNFIYEMYKQKPNDQALMAPDKIQGCYLVSGEWGVPGSVILWYFYHDGIVETAKEIVEEVDDALHKVVFKVIEGVVLTLYNPLILTVNIEDLGDKKLLTWTIDFEKVNAIIPDPTPYLDLLCAVVGDMDAYFLTKP